MLGLVELEKPLAPGSAHVFGPHRWCRARRTAEEIPARESWHAGQPSQEGSRTIGEQSRYSCMPDATRLAISRASPQRRVVLGDLALPQYLAGHAHSYIPSEPPSAPKVMTVHRARTRRWKPRCFAGKNRGCTCSTCFDVDYARHSLTSISCSRTNSSPYLTPQSPSTEHPGRLSRTGHPPSWPCHPRGRRVACGW